MMQVERRVGRLAEVRYREPLTIDELSAFIANVRGLVAQATDPLVFCCDWREVDAFDATFIDTLVWTMRRDNPSVAANGVLVSAGNAALREQVTEILRDARNANRQIFTPRAEVASFLDPMLDGAERRRRDEFLDEGRATASLPSLRAAQGRTSRGRSPPSTPIAAASPLTPPVSSIASS